MEKFILILMLHISINAISQNNLSDITYLKKVEYCFKNPNRDREIVKSINYFINDTLFYNVSYSGKNIFKVVNGVWYVDNWQNKYTPFYHPDSNRVIQLPFDVKEYNKAKIIIFDDIKKLKSICIDGIKVETLGVYNSSTLDLIQVLYFTPKLGIIAYMSSGYGPAFRNDVNKVIEYDSNNNKVAEYDFNLKKYYKDKFKINCECSN